MGMTIAEKILSRSCGRKVTPGDLVYPEPDLIVLTDVHAFYEGKTITEELRSVGCDKVVHPERCMVTLDHTMPVTNPNVARTVKGVREVVAELGVTCALR